MTSLALMKCSDFWIMALITSRISIYTDVRVSLKIDFSSFAKELRTKSCHSRQTLTKLIPFFTWTSAVTVSCQKSEYREGI